MENVAISCVLIGIVLLSFANLLLLYRVAQHGFGWFFLCLFIPVAGVYWIIMNWEDGKAPFKIYVVGIVFTILGFMSFVKTAPTLPEESQETVQQWAKLNRERNQTRPTHDSDDEPLENVQGSISVSDLPESKSEYPIYEGDVSLRQQAKKPRMNFEAMSTTPSQIMAEEAERAENGTGDAVSERLAKLGTGDPSDPNSPSADPSLRGKISNLMERVTPPRSARPTPTAAVARRTAGPANRAQAKKSASRKDDSLNFGEKAFTSYSDPASEESAVPTPPRSILP